MTPPTIADLLKYADLQMAAEAFLVATNDPAKTPFKGQALIDALTEGNKHASRFTKAQAEHFEKHWAVEAQQSNTRTGFSGTVFRCHTDDPLTGAKAGEVVMCFRSTEFVDDAARDNESTNVLEIKETGFAWGQLRDMEAWYQKLIQDGKLVEGQFSLTGYSLGGHLASAFNEMHPTAAKQVVTFNGAGIGAVDPSKKLSTLLTQFTDLTKPNADGSAKFSFSHPVLSAIYERTRAAGGLISQADKNTLAAFILDAQRDATPASDVAEAEWLQKAAGRVAQIRGEIGRLPGLKPQPVAVPLEQVEQCSLDYQLAVLKISQSTNAEGLLQGLIQTYGGKTVHWEFANQFDVQGDTSPSAVANSQNHVGKDVRVFIEDQPLYRGNVATQVALESLQYASVKLLVDGWDKKDFGDTHSLVLLVDSLAVQTTLLNMLPEAQRQAGFDALQKALTDASNRRKANGDAVFGGGQGKADGETLEVLVNALAALVLGPDAAKARKLVGSNDGNTWHETNPKGGATGRTEFHRLLDDIQKSDLYRKAQAGELALSLISTYASDLEKQARNDFGVFVALYTLSPFALRLGEGEVAKDLLSQSSVWGEIYAHWNEDRLRVNPPAGGATTLPKYFSDRWLKDRADLLVHLNSLNRENLDYVKGSPGDNPQVKAEDDKGAFDGSDVVWYDKDSGLKIQRGEITGKTRFVTFGSDLMGAATPQAAAVKLAMDAIQLSSSAMEEIAGHDERDVIYGESGDDRITGGDGRDRLDGGEGDDTLGGGEKDDALEGAMGDDLLSGDAGNDMLKGGDGDDALEGGSGHDVLIGGTGADRLRGGAEHDLLVDEGGSDTNHLWGDEGNDQLEVLGGAGFSFLDGGSGNDVLIGSQQSAQNTLAGGRGNDLLRGGEGADILHGDGGEAAEGSDGADLIEAGGGADLITGGGGSDLLRGGAGNDEYRFDGAGFGTDLIDDADGLGRLVFAGQELKSASFDEDKQCWVGAGRVEIRKLESEGATTLAISLPGDAHSTVYLRNWTPGQLGLTLTGEPKLRDRPTATPVKPQSRAENNFVDFVRGDAVDADQGNDLLVGSDASSLLLGGTGNDLLDGRGGDDWLEGGEGTDLILTGAGKDVVLGGGGKDLIRAGYRFDMSMDKVYTPGGGWYAASSHKIFFSQGAGGAEWLATDENTRTQFSYFVLKSDTPGETERERIDIAHPNLAAFDFEFKAELGAGSQPPSHLWWWSYANEAVPRLVPNLSVTLTLGANEQVARDAVFKKSEAPDPLDLGAAMPFKLELENGQYILAPGSQAQGVAFFGGGRR